MPTLQFKGKSLVQNYHLTVPYCELVADKKASLTKKISLQDNLIIHGDNLKALKALLPIYQGKVNCIYIDPPYNTGNEGWAYNDNVNDPMLKEWLGKTVDKDDLTRHDKWLCMMWPRLRLFRDLLSDAGVIFISIDDNEQAHLRSIMDEIFGEEHFLAQFIWKSRQNKDNRNVTGASVDHEYVLCFGKKIRGDDRKVDQFSNPDNDPRGPWTSGNLVGLADEEARPNLHYDLIDPRTGINYGKPAQGWRHDRKRMAQNIAESRVLWPSSADGRPRIKVFLSEMKDEFTGFSSIVSPNVFTRDGGKEVEELFGSRKFDFPKPTGLLKDLLRQGCPADGIILDSFAGSGTTAHAVLALNKEDGGTRKFICVETLDYADELTAERVRRVIEGVPTAKTETLREGLGGTFSFFTLGKPIEIQTILNGTNLPPYEELARYIFFMATGEEWNPKKLDIENCYVGESENYQVYLFYRPDIEYLKNTALTLKHAEKLPAWTSGGKRRLVFAPTKYLDQDFLDRFGIDFARLPYEIYQLASTHKRVAG
jgi:adenine-specific DNA-methyltransferase